MSNEHPVTFKRLQREESASFDRSTMDYIHRASNTGLYEIRGLGADAQIEPLGDADITALTELLAAAGLSHKPQEFKRVASARSLYHWNADADQTY